MQHALYLAPFGELADPEALADLAAEAEATGWDGLYLWDHVHRPPKQAAEIADVWICLAAIAIATERIRLGALVTPLSRRRPIKLAREIATSDRLSGGRLTVGIGLGVDTDGELTRFGEVVDPVARGAMLDEGLPVLAQLLSGEYVIHRGPAYTVDGITLAPPPVQTPRPPIWLAARGSATRPLRRAAGYEGLFPIEVDVEQLAAALDTVAAVRGSLDGFDVVINGSSFPTAAALAEVESLGVTWRLADLDPRMTLAEVRRIVQAGPPGA